MEAAPSKKPPVRLAVLGLGVLATVGMVMMTIGMTVATMLANRHDDSTAERPEWDEIETGRSYRLPIAERQPTPVARLATGTQRSDYEPPAYTEPVFPPQAKPLDPNPSDERSANSSSTAPLVIHNPAAFGPPEDGSLPTPPGAQVVTRANADGPGFTRPSAAIAPPPIQEVAGMSRPPVASHTPPETPDPATLVEAPQQTKVAEQTKPVTRLAHGASRSANLEELAPVDGTAKLGYTLSTNALSKRLEGDVQAAFRLGKSGAVYAARDRFERVLRRIALAKDAEEGSTRHARALAEGLRALENADDFLPRGDALETQLDVAAIAKSHGLKLVGEGITPHEAIARYSHHAAQRLSLVAADEPAGSMALYGLGKTYTRLESQGDLTAGRKSMVMYRAATHAQPTNYLAANELGVRLARDGHYEQAGEVLRTAAERPGATAMIHANLAAIQQKLGHNELAAFAQHQSEQLAQSERAAGEVSRRHGVQWVSPEDFQRLGSGPHVAPASPSPPFAATAPATGQPTQEPGGLSGWVRTAKRSLGWGSPPPGVEAAPPTGYRPPTQGPPQAAIR